MKISCVLPLNVSSVKEERAKEKLESKVEMTEKK
jgi:hypothetical protein